MTDQTRNEIIKALAYGRTAEQAAEAEDVPLADVQQIARKAVNEIMAERELLRKAGYLYE